MGDDWQTGDLALCVLGGQLTPRTFEKRQNYPVSGRIYTVISYVHDGEFIGGQCPGLLFSDAPLNEGVRIWSAERFRKIHPHTPDAEDAETIRLLNGIPITEPA